MSALLYSKCVFMFMFVCIVFIFHSHETGPRLIPIPDKIVQMNGFVFNYFIRKVFNLTSKWLLCKTKPTDSSHKHAHIEMKKKNHGPAAVENWYY